MAFEAREQIRGVDDEYTFRWWNVGKQSGRFVRLRNFQLFEVSVRDGRRSVGSYWIVRGEVLLNVPMSVVKY
jgi:hypothetical protein